MTRKEPYEIPFSQYQFMRIVEEDERRGGLNHLTPTFKRSVEQAYKRSVQAAIAGKKRVKNTILKEWRAWGTGKPEPASEQPETRLKIKNPHLPRRYAKLERFLAERIRIAHMKPAEEKKIAALLRSLEGAALIAQNSDNKVRLFYAAICLTHNNALWALNKYRVSPSIHREARIAAGAAFIGENNLLRRISATKPPGNGPRIAFQKGPRVSVPPFYRLISNP